MSGVYIRDVEMPKSCGNCFFDTRCDNWRLRNWGAPPPDDCPLVPVPPHYDLIDHNALKIAVMDCDAETRIDFLKHAMDCINKAPVVIPSDMPTDATEEGE